MTLQVHHQQGRINHPLQAILFFSALLVFIFTVAYRMIRSESFSQAIATLIESLLIVSFFIFFGILLAYLIYFIYERLHQEPRRKYGYNRFGDRSATDEPAGKSDPVTIDFVSQDEVESQTNS